MIELTVKLDPMTVLILQRIAQQQQQTPEELVQTLIKERTKDVLLIQP